MILIGYQGIGKSTLAGRNKFIDLESGSFWVDGSRDPEWYKPYCQIALHLSKQGYKVFTSSHQVVRDYLREITSEEEKDQIWVIYPATFLRDAWVAKLNERYQTTGTDKDFKALMNAEDRYVENVQELAAESWCGGIEIRDMDYRLEDLIFEFCEVGNSGE